MRGPWWFTRRRELTDEQRHELLAQLFFEGPDRRPFLDRFATLLSLSVLIAVFGLAEGSPPVVIGAMLVSPLTTPLMGLSAALVMAWPRRQLESLGIVAAATVGGIGLAWATLLVIPEPAAVTLQSDELLARTEPRLLDLAIAIAAGAAGAYVLVRREAIGALPGVAIAVALVPPLSTVGMTLELGREDLADDAFLLYLTNLAGIVLAASVVLLLAGMRPHTVDGRLPRRATVGLAAAALGVLVVAYPLGAVTAERAVDEIDRDDVERAVRDWIGGTGLELVRVRATDDSVDVDVRGPKRPPSLDPLARRLAAELENDVRVRVGWTRQRRFRAEAAP